MSRIDVTARQAEAHAARARLQETLQQLQQRLSPRSIAGEVKDKAFAKADGALTAAREGVANAATHPSTVAAISVPILMYLFRKPIGGALQSLRGREDDAAEPARAPATPAKRKSPRTAAKASAQKGQ